MLGLVFGGDLTDGQLTPFTASTRKGANVGRVRLRRLAADDAEPADKVDAMSSVMRPRGADGGVAVNGPKDEPLNWDAVEGRQVEEDVRRLRQRISAASRAGNLTLLPDREPSGFA